jgi:hypothetical protein
MLSKVLEEPTVSILSRQNSIFTLLTTLNLRISSYITHLVHTWGILGSNISHRMHNVKEFVWLSIVFSISDVAVL